MQGNNVLARVNAVREGTLRNLEAQRRRLARPVDIRYEYSTCSKCGHKWQNIDYGSAHHQLVCGYPLPPRVEPAVAAGEVVRYA